MSATSACEIGGEMRNQVVTEYLFQLIANQVDDRGLVV
jgi:hypothetical protein